AVTQNRRRQCSTVRLRCAIPGGNKSPHMMTAVHQRMAAPAAKRLLAMLLLWMLSGWAVANHQPLVLEQNHDRYSLADSLRMLEDPQQSLTISEVAQTANAARFSPVLKSHAKIDLNLGYTRSAWWFA